MVKDKQISQRGRCKVRSTEYSQKSREGQRQHYLLQRARAAKNWVVFLIVMRGESGLRQDKWTLKVETEAGALRKKKNSRVII